MSAATVVAQPGTESVTMRSIPHSNSSNQFHDTLRSVLDLCSSEFSPRIA